MPSETTVRDIADATASDRKGEERQRGEDRRTRPRLRSLVLISLAGVYFASLLLIYVEFSLIKAGEY